MVPLLWALTVILLSGFFGQAYSPDSYAYLMLGKNIVSGHGYWSPAIRESVIGATFNSRTFPPLMPLLVGITEVLFKQGIVSGFIDNLLILYGMFHVCYLIGKRVINKFFYFIIIAAFFFVLINGPFIIELLAGRSIPLATLIILSIIYLLMIKEIRLSTKYAILGVLAGLLYLTRFDASLFCIGLPLIVLLLTKDKFKNLLIAYLAFAMVISPWLVSNVMAFGKPFAADQSILIFSIYDGNAVLRFFNNGIPTISLNPLLWVNQRVVFILYSIFILYELITPFGIIPVVGGAIVIGLFVMCFTENKKENHLLLLNFITLFWITNNIITVSLTKYSDTRYFSISAFLIVISTSPDLSNMA